MCTQHEEETNNTVGLTLIFRRLQHWFKKILLVDFLSINAFCPVCNFYIKFKVQHFQLE